MLLLYVSVTRMTRNIAAVFLILFAYVSPENNNNNDDCTCVLYFQCDHNGYIMTDGENVIDARGLNTKCSENISAISRPQRSSGVKSDQGVDPKCSYVEVCCKLRNQTAPAKTVSVKTTHAKRNNPNKCGFLNSETIDHKNESTISGFGEFPWTVAILNCKNTYQCAGSLIHPSVVLTAAQCISENATYSVIAGVWDTQSEDEKSKQQNRRVLSIQIHENFKVGTLVNDIALLFLESPFDLKSHINLTCMPSLQTVDDTSRCFVTGWGKNSFNNGKFAQFLKKVELPMVPKDACQQKLRKTRLGQFFQLGEGFVCAGGEEGKDVCKGDGGAPLVCPIPGTKRQYQQIGIASWGINCHEKDVPGVYTDVAFFITWINQQMIANNYDIPT